MRGSSHGPIRCYCIAALLACAKEKPEGNAADAGTPLLSEEEWHAATTPRSVPHEIWTAACDGSRVGQEYLWSPSVGCFPKYGAKTCVLVASCQTAADCTAQPNGICKGSPSNHCIYPGDDRGKSCELDSECTFRPGGSCRPTLGAGDKTCIPTGECRVTPSYGCAYPLFSEDCHGDTDCTAAPGGTCNLSVGGECRYNQCLSDSDCGPMARCDCQDVGRCVKAQCFSADDCGGFACAASGPLECANISPPVGYYCRSEQDECRSDDDCGAACAELKTSPPCGSSCVYDPAVSHWACRGAMCFTR